MSFLRRLQTSANLRPASPVRTTSSASLPTASTSGGDRLITKERFSTDVVKLFALSHTEAVLSEHPCAYRRKVSKAGKIYVTSSYFCFYSLIFNKEIRYVFGMFESTDNAYWALMKQYTYWVQMQEVKPITLLTPAQPKAEKDSASGANRPRFTSVSSVQKEEREEPPKNERSRSGSLPSYPTLGRPKKTKEQEEMSHLVSPQKRQIDTIHEEHQSSPTMSTSPSTSKQINSKRRASMTMPQEVISTAISSSPPIHKSGNHSPTAPHAQQSPNSSPPRSPPVLLRERSNTIFSHLKRTVKSSAKNKESADRINKMLLQRGTSDRHSLAALHLTDAVFGIALDDLRLDEHLRCPVIACMIMSHLESTKLSFADLYIGDFSGQEFNLLISSTCHGKEDAFLQLGSSPRLVGALLTHFFSQLPQALLPEDLLECDEIGINAYKSSSIRSILFSQPQFSWTLFKAFILHLIKLEPTNFSQLASLFGPLLLRTTTERDNLRATSIFIKGRQVVKAATVDVIILKLTDAFYRDDTLLDAFNLTHDDYFIKTNDYVDRILQRHAAATVGSGQLDAPWRCRLRERVLFLLKTLIESRPKYWMPNDPSIRTIKYFVKDYLTRATTYEESRLLLAIDDMIRCVENGQTIGSVSSQPTSIFASNPPTTRRTKNDFILGATRSVETRKFTILDCDINEVAIQITCIDERAFRTLSVFELLAGRFSTPDKSPLFQAMVRLFNRWSSWVGSEILRHPTPSQRAIAIERLIDIAAATLSLNNFHAAYAITTGLNHYSLRRLAITWDRVSKKSMVAFTSLQATFSTDANHKAYRERLTAAKPPLIPYLGLYTKDLFVIGDGQPNFLPLPVIAAPASPATVSPPLPAKKEVVIDPLSPLESLKQPMQPVTKQEGFSPLVSRQEVPRPLSLEAAFGSKLSTIIKEQLQQKQTPAVIATTVSISPLIQAQTTPPPSPPAASDLKMVNLDKMRSIHAIAKTWKIYRQTPYSLRPLEVLQAKILEREILNDDELYEKSLLLEPRAAAAASSSSASPATSQ
eukprot:gene19479-23334_t